jgi:hypothetical protein
LAFDLLVLFAHGSDVLLQGVNVILGLLEKMELENLNFKLELLIVVEGLISILLFFDPSHELVQILWVHFLFACVLIKGRCLDADSHIGVVLVVVLDRLNVDFCHFVW